MAKHAVLLKGATIWRSLPCPKSELRLDLSLACGQSFRWRETAEGHWTGVMGGRVWTLTQTDDTLFYYIYPNQDMQIEEAERMLRDYFQLNVNFADLCMSWGATDPHFKRIADTFKGVRMLRQDPTECLFSIICTINNNITRAQSMVEKLCEALGTPLCQLHQTSYSDFPSLSALADSSVEERLRDLGFGYRARFLQQSAKQILDTHGLQWLDGLRSVSYQQAHEALCTLPGVGNKVADCACLMSLDKAEAVPIDTHMWQIAKRDYNFTDNKKRKTITDQLYREIGDFFRNKWGPYAGWAQAVLFCADLKRFQKLKEMPNLKQPKKEEDNVEDESSM